MYYKLENDKVKVKFTSYGASIVSLFVKGKRNIVLTQEREEYYLNCNSYCGNTIGPVANRQITDSKIILHGGENGFSKKDFKARFTSTNSIEFIYREEELEVKVIYSLEDLDLIINHKVFTSTSKSLSLTTHTYFNLSGEETINEHYLKINSDRYLETNEEKIPTGKIIKDDYFSYLTKINNNVLDNSYCFDSRDLKTVSILKSDDLRLEVLSTCDNTQVYTGDYLQDSNSLFKQRSAIAIEPQRYSMPSVNTELPSNVVENEYNETIIYRISEEK